jgi:hypothetical protein
VILRDAFVSINGTDFTDECREVEVNDGRAEHDNTVMKMSAESVEAGLAQWTITIKLRQNYAAGKVHQVIRPLVGTICTVIVRPDANQPAGPTNEEVHGLGMFLKYVPIGGAAGQPQEPVLEFKNTGQALTYTGGSLLEALEGREGVAGTQPVRPEGTPT